jgi:anti-sigma-K factor RskA
MASSMPSDQLQLLIAGYVLGDLDPDEAAEFEQLLADNPALMEEVTQMQKTLELCYAPPAVTPPAHLRAAILTPKATKPTPIQPNRGRVSWSKAMGVAAAALIVGLGINNYRLWRALQVAQTQLRATEAAQAEKLTYALQAGKLADAARATVAVDPNTLEGVLTVEGLPPLPPGKTYALWVVPKPGAPYTTDDKGAILIKAFQVDAEGTVSRPITVPEVYRSEELVSKVAITIEDATAPQDHQGSPVLITN